MEVPCAVKDHPKIAFLVYSFLYKKPLLPFFYRSVYVSMITDKEKALLWQITIYLLDIYTENSYNDRMIKSFADRETEKVFNQSFSRKLPQSIQRVALRKLIMIHNAGCLEDLRVPPANHLEPLHGDREGQYSIRINDQYRICFTVEGNNFFHVEIVDYH